MVVLTDASGAHQPFRYSRFQSGAITATIEGVYTYFGVVISDTEILGTNTTPPYPFDIKKD